MRARFGLPSNRPLVAFVGHFDENKGPLRLMKALENRPDIGILFAGSGALQPTGSQVLFCDRVPHGELPMLLSAADVFALPTLSEGSCNAVLEALACGLPVVSSDRPFNDGHVDDEVGIRIDPMDPISLGSAIGELIDDPERRARLSSKALSRAPDLSHTKRNRELLAWFQELCDESGRREPPR